MQLASIGFRKSYAVEYRTTEVAEYRLKPSIWKKPKGGRSQRCRYYYHRLSSEGERSACLGVLSIWGTELDDSRSGDGVVIVDWAGRPGCDNVDGSSESFGESDGRVGLEANDGVRETVEDCVAERSVRAAATLQRKEKRLQWR